MKCPSPCAFWCLVSFSCVRDGNGISAKDSIDQLIPPPSIHFSGLPCSRKSGLFFCCCLPFIYRHVIHHNSPWLEDRLNKSRTGRWGDEGDILSLSLDRRSQPPDFPTHCTTTNVAVASNVQPPLAHPQPSESYPTRGSTPRACAAITRCLLQPFFPIRDVSRRQSLTNMLLIRRRRQFRPVTDDGLDYRIRRAVYSSRDVVYHTP